MAKQLVVIGNRVVAHGTECFADIGGAVVCLTNGKVYAGASIVECTTECPADIDAVGYEYHAGVFVKCGPFSKGSGNVAVWCDECKAPLDSGFPSEYLGKVFFTTYSGNGSTSCGVECGFRPKMAVITCLDDSIPFVCIMGTANGYSFGTNRTTANNGGNLPVKVTATDTGLYWSSTTALGAMNEASGYLVSHYEITIWG